MPETVLIVDDEDGVRRTFVEWLHAAPNVRVLAAADAEAALRHANAEPIDLAVLDWNLGSGSDGLRLLEDLVEFRPDVVAILVTGFANQATPLDALRMGVRDYLDKNQDLNRETFLAAVERQLALVRPAKRQRELNQSLASFRQAVEVALPLVRSAAALNDPVPLPAASFDVVMCCDVIEHLPDPARFVADFRRLLKPGGWLLLSFGPPWYHPHGKHMWVKLPGWWTHLLFPRPAVMRAAGADSTATWADLGLQRLSVGKFERVMRASGFRAVYQRHSIMRPLTPLKWVPGVREFFIGETVGVYRNPG